MVEATEKSRNRKARAFWGYFAGETRMKWHALVKFIVNKSVKMSWFFAIGGPTLVRQFPLDQIVFPKLLGVRLSPSLATRSLNVK